VKAFLNKLNDLPIFDPARWPQRELLSRLAGLSICAGFIIHRILRFTKYTGAPPQILMNIPGILKGDVPLAGIHPGMSDWHWLMWFTAWILETGIFAGYILAFMTRSEARSVAKGFMELVFPFIIAAIPIVITLTPMNFTSIWPPLLQTISGSLTASSLEVVHRAGPFFRNWEPAFFLFLAIIICGGIMNLTGLITLRKAFTITSEARIFIRHGIFSIVRHPLYTGHFIMFFGYVMFHLYWYTALLYCLFVLGQYFRARIEEKKLMGIFPEYAVYMEDTGMFFPHFR
jgi:protein-S-isoprenylcysteine O-methyltransferase Ste14